MFACGGMESCKLRMVALLEISLLWGFAVCAHGAPNHENVIDLLAALNMTHQISGVTRVQSSSTVVYKIRPRAPYLTLPHEYSQFLYSNLQGSMGVHLVGHHTSGSSATVFSLSSASSLILQIVSSTINNTLRLDYRARGRAQGLASFHFPRGNPFSREEWVQLAVSLEPDRLAFFVDCEEAAVLPLKSETTINLDLPQDVIITLASVQGKKYSKFNGYLKKAEISLKAYQQRPWHCDNVTDALSPSQQTETRSPDFQTDSSQNASPSKLQPNYKQPDQANHHPQDIQSDQHQRGTVFGPPGSPQGLKPVAQAQRDDRLRKMERKLEELAHMLDMVKAENANLQKRIKLLEECECMRRQCVWEGREVQEGQRWQTDINTVCSCTSGKVTCQPIIKHGDPCLSNPCQNGGTCFVLTSDPAGFHCSCPPNTKGPVCHRQQRQACWEPKPKNNCEGVQSLHHHWAFNPTSGLCEDFLYCTGNSSNNFPSLNACRDSCMLGACCLRKPKQDHPNNLWKYIQDEYNIHSVNRTLLGDDKLNLDDEIWYSNTELLYQNKRANCHGDEDFTYDCDYLTLTQCQALMKEEAGLVQVVSFSPGMKCSDIRCGGSCGCFSHHKLWRYGQRFGQGCEDCICTPSGRADCVCRHLTQRKEIRDLTLRERRLYQRAIRKLYAKPTVWKGFALLRAEFSPQAGDHAFFLPWHRYFLRLVENELQSVSSCKMAIPYFEWTVDTGSMKSSAAWQAGLFGGDGEPESDCVPHHPFQGLTSHFHWTPCLRRSFNSSEDKRECSPQPCPPHDCKESVPRDYRGCTHVGVQYDNGARWRSTDNPCDICYCSEGHVHCEREKCDTPCTNPGAPPPNTCCPVCQGCGVNGHDYPNGAVVPTEDHCQQCACVNGNVVCSAIRCPALPCRNPVHHAGDCCPRCDWCEYESQVYVNGQKFSSRADPCLHCRCSEGEVSCEHMDSSCPPPHCSHPARRKGECCPTCDECEYDRRIYADGKSFNPAGSGPCLQCRCKAGNVICHEEKCPPVQCSNPIREPHHCCPKCKTCVSEGVEYEEGARWQPEGHCSICTCINGEISCPQPSCPPIDCLHPTRNTGSCCAVCDSCTYNNRIYNNGQRFTTPDQPCHSCTCLHGTVECERRPCPQLNCPNPYTLPGECCPKCPDCSYENRVFVDGDAFPNPTNVCEECKCVSGRIDCNQPNCPQPHCNAPRPGTCCQNNCNGCSYAGKEHQNGEEFPHPTDPCRTCTCINGNVQCLMRRCPPLSCSNPNVVPGECCPQCPAPPSACTYEQRSYRHTEHFYHPTDNCQSCTCNDGEVRCHRKPCPFASCSHPITQECCRTCEGCLYEGRERANGEMWDDASDPCAVCVCREGSVQCERKRCPSVNCKHPVQRQCCASCDGCMFHGKEYRDGSEFRDDNDPCGVCYCYGGEVTCSRIPCHGHCSHPYKPPDQCCGECERCFFNNALLLNGQSIPDPGNPCSECICQSGSVRCVKKPCPPVRCPHPATNACGCPVCDGCHFHGVNYADGQILPGGDEGCQDCTCSRGDVVCTQRRCPDVSCPHPARDRCSCRVCDGCNFYGRDSYNGERFMHPADHCQHCSCLNGGVVCTHASCPNVVCRHPVTRPGECCPVCTGICLYQGKEYQPGSTFISPSDPCSSCSCLNELVNCQRRPCPVQCSHPVPSDSCCPVCDSCLYAGAVHSHGHTFTLPSNPCQRCTCVRGTVTCVPLVCPPTPCAQPFVKPGQCCPECPVAACMLEGQEFRDGQTWPLSSNPCSTCTCQTGEVQCVSSACPKLSCMHQVTDPGSCCPRCRGCMYGGEEYPEGNSWFADSTPCMTCMCVDGVTTCSEVRCLSPCINFINVPGECCPVCADCIFEGSVYGPGESFHPANDPCQICTCEVMPDGEQHLRCYRKQCPSLVDCPKSNILFSGPDSCCPVCAQPLSNCTAALIGNEVLATDDPCYTCHCKDLTWTCLHQTCPPLTCPPNEQITPPDSCCPVCQDCVIEGQNKRMANGTTWTDSDDDCVKCTCNLGSVECIIEECSPVVCLSGQRQVKIPGKCCYECQDSGASCLYQGTAYQSNEEWAVDQCTSCTCVSGDVHCHSERCPPLTCATDEMPAVVPGLCCPHCLPRPATCIAFGDPHYRTFDGRMLHFQGTCTYVLAQDCEGGHFSVHVTNDDRGRKGVSWTKEVTVFLGDVTVQLLQDWVVKVNGEVVTLPFLREPYIYIERQTNTILLNTNIGLKVLWSPRSHLEVSVPGSYKSHTCGLCGNFNNYYQDDLQMRGGRISLSESDFGNSWRVTNGSHSISSCRPGEDVDPCKDAGYQAKKGANARCKVLKSAVFKPCHRVVPPEPWYGACVYDLCACGANTDECLCDTLEAYASQCREAGVVLQWRSASLCAVGCPVERGFVFDECGPPCPVTCFNVDVPLGVIESHCFKPCVPGCQCPAGLVLHNNYCIRPEKCPKIIHGNT